VKLLDLLYYLSSCGCERLRESGNHSWWWNPSKNLHGIYPCRRREMRSKDIVIVNVLSASCPAGRRRAQLQLSVVRSPLIGCAQAPGGSLVLNDHIVAPTAIADLRCNHHVVQMRVSRHDASISTPQGLRLRHVPHPHASLPGRTYQI
jgi:hypothetical protein